MKKIYHLANCTTCQRILREIQPTEDFEYQNIKEQAITSEQLVTMKAMAGSYEALFSRRARKYRTLDLKNQQLTEEDYKNYILQEYTFLKRPVIIIDGDIFVGNAKKVVQAAKTRIAQI